MKHLLTILIVPLLFATAVDAGLVYDAVADFSTTTNSESSTWSYRGQAGLTRDGAYDLLPFFVVDPPLWHPDVGGWRPSNTPTFDPAVGANKTGVTVSFTGSASVFFWPNNTINMHPDPNELIVISWLSPADLLVNINFSFTDLDPNGGDGVAWFVDRGDSSGSLDSGVLPNGGASGLKTITNLSVLAGERINFIVSPPTSNHGFDSTGFIASITQVPEPVSGSILGLLGLAMLCRRTRVSTS